MWIQKIKIGSRISNSFTILLVIMISSRIGIGMQLQLPAPLPLPPLVAAGAAACYYTLEFCQTLCFFRNPQICRFFFTFKFPPFLSKITKIHESAESFLRRELIDKTYFIKKSKP